MKAPYTIFGKTKNVPVKVWYQNEYHPEMTEWDDEIWIERGEDWYQLMSVKDKRVRVIERNVWLRCEEI